MRYLFYTNYQSGCSGLSNGIMSVEIGVILAHLTNRLLVLDGNISPPANIVAYDGRVTNARTSKITDLVEIPVPWVEPNEVDLQHLESLELTNFPLYDLAFYFPKTLDLSTSDARSFSRNRNHWVTVTGEHDRIPVLRLSEEPTIPGTTTRRNNLGSYSYQFYFDSEVRRSVYTLLQRMQAKRPFSELAKRVARDIGPFNAVHLRRGDFKVTYGVTTLDRKPCEAIEAMDQVFRRKEPLVILTDERDDPFFSEIKLAYPQHYFIDWHILENYGSEFARLPQTDSLSLAYLSQLVAAESTEFMGTMTSTFTGLIQRYRGSGGKDEAFRYLWNELPEPTQEVERGRHPVSECIALDRGQMIEQFTGTYSWNRVSQLLNPAWMREWPESFLLPEVLATGSLFPSDIPPADIAPAAVALVAPISPVAPAVARATPVVAPPRLFTNYITFENLQVSVTCNDAGVLKQLAPDFGTQSSTPPRNVIADFIIESEKGGACSLEQRGRGEKILCDRSQLLGALKHRVATVFSTARHKYAWLIAAAFVKDSRGLVVAGDVVGPDEAFRRALQMHGWEMIDSALFSVRLEDLAIVPIGARTQPEGAGAPTRRVSAPLDGLVITAKAPLHARHTTLAPLSPAAAVAAMLSSSLDFHIERDRAMNGLCRMIENRPAAQLYWNHPRDAAQMISRWADVLLEVAA